MPMASSTQQSTASTRAVRITGWVWFAGILLMVGGVFNIIHGFAALERKEYFTSDIVYNNLTFWGWVFLIWGAAQLYAGAASVAGRLSGNYVGVIVAGTAAILWFFMVFTTPWAALIGVMLNILVVYGLTAGAVDEWAT
jgi:hypothetical protein